MSILASRLLGSLLALLWAGTALASPPVFERFGLTHATLGTATLYTNTFITGFRVEHITTNGQDGVATELGAADSGAFIFPNSISVDVGYAMMAHAYGSVNAETNRPVSTLYGYRSDYGTYHVGADFSSLGATSATFQLWYGNVLKAEGTMDPGEEVVIYASYGQPPRANPWWRQPNGEHGAAIEFTFLVPVRWPGCPAPDCPLYGDRIFIRPNGATGVVDYVSRTEVFGSGGLSSFSFDQMQPGVFGRAHTALENARLIAQPGFLQVTNLSSGPEDSSGVLVEFGPASRARVDLSPIEIANPASNEGEVELSAAGARANSYTYAGSLKLANSNGTVHLSAHFIYEDEFVTAQIFSNDVAVGSGTFTTDETVRIDGAPRLTSFEARPDTLAGPNSFNLRFDANATFTFSNGTQFAGDSVVIRGSQTNAFADVKTIAVVVRALPSFTIVAESSSFDTPQIEFIRSGPSLFLRWADPARAFTLESKTAAGTIFTAAEIRPSYSNGMATVQVPNANVSEFFRLRRFSYPYVD